MEDKNAELYEKLSRLQWLLGRHHMQNHTAHGPFADPTRGQGRVLAMLKMQPEISSKDLSYLLGIRQQSLNELLNKLEKSGHVVREPSEEDRRIMLVKLTEKGKAEQRPSMDYSDIFDCLNSMEQVAFAEYLDRVIAVLEEQVGTDKDEEEQVNWEKAARERFGDEIFEQMMSSRGGFGAHNHGPFGRDFFRGDGPDERSHFGRRPRGRRNSPQQPPEPPHKLDDE